MESLADDAEPPEPSIDDERSTAVAEFNEDIEPAAVAEFNDEIHGEGGGKGFWVSIVVAKCSRDEIDSDAVDREEGEGDHN